MSAIYFHSEHGDAAVRGMERFLAAAIVKNLFDAACHNYRESPGYAHWVRRHIPAEHYLHSAPKFETSASSAIHYGDLSFFIDGQSEPAWRTVLNTAMVLGGEAVQFVTRLHAQCEVHAYVEGSNRAWLAGVIERALAASILRSGMGWDGVVALLLSRADCPVVLSYSVCDQFPRLPDGATQEERDEFYELPRQTQWARGMACIRSIGGLEWAPDTFGSARFGRGYTAMRLQAMALATNTTTVAEKARGVEDSNAE